MRIVDLQSPAANIQAMRPVVSQFTVTPVPKPVPVVVNHVFTVSPSRRWSLPHIVIQMLGRCGINFLADGAANPIEKSATQIDLTNHTCMQFRDRRLVSGTASSLIANLHAALVLVGRLYHPFTFLWIVRSWFLHIHMLASFASEYGCWTMPVIWCGTNEGIDGRIIKYSTKIGNQHSFSSYFGNSSNTRFPALPIRFTDVLDDHSRNFHHLFGQVSTSAVAHHPDDHRFGVFFGRFLGMHTREGKHVCRCGRCHRVGKKGSSFHEFNSAIPVG